MSEFEHRTSPNAVAAGSALHCVQKRLSLGHCMQHSAYRGPHEATDLRVCNQRLACTAHLTHPAGTSHARYSLSQW